MNKFWKSGLAAIEGSLSGLADAAELEDVKRKDLTEVALKSALSSYDSFQQEKQTMQKVAKEEEAAVESLKGQVIAVKDGSTRLITNADALKLIRQFGAKEAMALILGKSISISGKGAVEQGEGTSRKLFDLEAMGKTSSGSGGLFAKDRYSQVAENTASALQTLGIDPENVVMPGQKVVTGDIKVFAGPSTNKIKRERYYTDLAGIPANTVTRVDTTDIANNTTFKYFSLDGTDVTDQIQSAMSNPASKAKLSSTRTDVFPDVTDIGFAYLIRDDGTVKLQNFSVAIFKDGSTFRQGEDGKYDQEVPKNIITLSTSAVSALQGDVKDAFNPLGKDGAKAYQSFAEQAEAHARVSHTIKSQVGLLKRHGSALVAPIGEVAVMVEFLKTNFGIIGTYLKDKSEYQLSEAAYASLQEQTSALQNKYETTNDPKDKLSVARTLFNANQILLAYTSARAVTSDTRISNQDFDLFRSTVSAGNDAAQIEIFKARYNDATLAVQEKFRTLKSYALDDEAKKIIDNIPPERTSAGMQATHLEIFGENANPEITVAGVTKRHNTLEKVAGTYPKTNIAKRFINGSAENQIKNGNGTIVGFRATELVDSNFKGRVEVFVVLDDKGNPAKTQNGIIVYTTNGLNNPSNYSGAQYDEFMQEQKENFWRDFSKLALDNEIGGVK